MQTYTPSGGLSPASGLFASLLPAIAPKSLRAAISDEIERLIAHLDELDGDADLEETGDLEPSLGGYTRGYDLELDTSDDEPSLGSLGSCGATYGLTQSWAGGANDDREEGDGDLEPDHEGEPSLGSLDRMLNQEHWTSTSDSCDACSDRELDDCDDEDGGDDEPGTDIEPSLGSLGGTAMAVDGQGWTGGTENDCELDDSDREHLLDGRKSAKVRSL